MADVILHRSSLGEKYLVVGTEVDWASHRMLVETHDEKQMGVRAMVAFLRRWHSIEESWKILFDLFPERAEEFEAVLLKDLCAILRD